ncbi:MAG: class I SAM-dependent methyltransferase [Chloroflexota bacterium]
MMSSTPKPLNFATTWADYARHNNYERHSDAGEIAFWRQHASGYDIHIHQDPDSYRETLRTIRAFLRPDDTLLDVGAGTGRFTLPLAEHVQSSTALDLSPAMLEILQQKIVTRDLVNITTVQGNWEDTHIQAHDVVLAAWSLYRQRDILASLQKLIDTTRRTLIIVDGDYAPRPDDDPPHERIKSNIWGAGDPGLCNYLYFAGMLRQCRVRTDVRVVHERMTRIAPDVLTLAREFVPHDAHDDEIAEFAKQLQPYAEKTAEGFRYTCHFAVGLVIWQRRD